MNNNIKMNNGVGSEYEFISENIYNTNETSENRLKILVQSIPIESMIPNCGRGRLTKQVKRINPDDSLEEVVLFQSDSLDEFEQSEFDILSKCAEIANNSSSIHNAQVAYNDNQEISKLFYQSLEEPDDSENKDVNFGLGCLAVIIKVTILMHHSNCFE